MTLTLSDLHVSFLMHRVWLAHAAPLASASFLISLFHGSSHFLIVLPASCSQYWGVCHPESLGCKAVPFFYPEHEAVNSARKNEVLLIYTIYRFALNRSFSMKSNVVSFPSVTPYSRSVL